MPSCGRRPEGLSKKAHQLIQINGPQDPKRSACFPENCVATPVRRRIFFIDGKGNIIETARFSPAFLGHGA
jgi:hypothetical protein